MYPAETNCSMTCHDNYFHTFGKQTIECLSTGNWSGPPIECEGMKFKCFTLVTLLISYLSQHHKHMSVSFWTLTLPRFSQELPSLFRLLFIAEFVLLCPIFASI